MAAWLFVLAIALGVAAAMLSMLSARVRRRNAAFRRLAVQYRGEFASVGFWSRPLTVFSFAGATVCVDTLRTGGYGGGDYTQFSIQFPDQGLRCEVYVTGFFSRSGTLLGIADIQIGVPAFDERYAIIGNYPTAIRELLSSDVRDRIEELRRLGPCRDVYLSINGGRLIVRQQGWVTEAGNLGEFTRICLALYAAAISTLPVAVRGSAVPGEIEFLPTTAKQTVRHQDVTCQVCGELIVEGIVLCKSCRTPHHEDCWEYYGACSTYGCGQTSFQPALRRPSKS